MKKTLILLSALLLSGCGCMLSQIPPQKIYAGAGCQAPLPNYLLKVTATDNCELASLTQTPAAGYLLTSSNKVATVVIKASDASGNFTQVTFTVTLVDTIKPKIEFDPSLLSSNLEQIKDLYNFGDKLLAWSIDYWAGNFNNEQFPQQAFQQDSAYYKQMMLTWTSPAFAITGKGGRWHTWINASDTIFVLPKTTTVSPQVRSVATYLDYDLNIPHSY
jgi:hypothetical protein